MCHGRPGGFRSAAPLHKVAHESLAEESGTPPWQRFSVTNALGPGGDSLRDLIIGYATTIPIAFSAVGPVDAYLFRSLQALQHLPFRHARPTEGLVNGL